MVDGLRAFSPGVAVPDQPFESLAITRVKPEYAHLDPHWRVLKVIDEDLPEPISVSPTDPRCMWLLRLNDLAGRTDFDAGFIYFLKGVAVYALIIDQAFHTDEYHNGPIEDMVRMAGERVLNGDKLPEIDEELAPLFQSMLNAVFSTREEIAYRPLIAFATGVLYLLSYTTDREVLHGPFSAVTWADRLVKHYAALSYVPE